MTWLSSSNLSWCGDSVRANTSDSPNVVVALTTKSEPTWMHALGVPIRELMTEETASARYLLASASVCRDSSPAMPARLSQTIPEPASGLRGVSS